MKRIPTYESPDYRQTVLLDGISYDIHLQWNQRDQSWRMAIGRTGSLYTARFKLTNGVDLLKPYRAYTGTPEGSMRVVDVEKYTGRVSYEGLVNGRFHIYYLTQQEEEDLFGG